MAPQSLWVVAVVVAQITQATTQSLLELAAAVAQIFSWVPLSVVAVEQIARVLLT